MVQKKHKKRKHNKPSAAALAQEENEQLEPKEMTRAEKKEAKAQAKAEQKKREAKLAAKGKDGRAARPSRWQRIKNWFAGVKTEMQRVVWPTRPELVNASLIVIGALVFFGVYIAIIDNVIIIPLDWIASLGE